MTQVAMSKYQQVIKVQRGHNSHRIFLTLECGHEVYRYQITPPEKVLCEHCHRQDWFPSCALDFGGYACTCGRHGVGKTK